MAWDDFTHADAERAERPEYAKPSYRADETSFSGQVCVRNRRGTIVCFTRECDGLTAFENAERLAQLLIEAESL